MGMEVDRLEIQVQAEASKAAAQLDKLISKLGNVSSALTSVNTSGLRNFASGVNQLSSAMEKMSGVKTTDFNRVTKGIEKLSTINESALYKSANGIRNFANSLNGISSVSDDAVKIGEIANNISKLGGAKVEKVVTTLPQLSIAFKEFMTTLSTAPNVSENVIRMTNAMSSLASNGSKFSSTVNGLSRAAKTLTRSNNEATTSTNLFGISHRNAISPVSSLTSQVNKLVGAYFTLRYVLGGITGSINKSMDFNETINLFQTSYKKIGEEAAVKNGMDWGSKSADAYAKAFIDRAQTFNDKLTQALSLDPNTMMNYQAVFAQISSAMGLTANTAENISESFTMLGNDIASLWNINTADAMQKLQAGLTGQVRPLRELGVDITQATLQLTAYKYGIKDSVKDMSQAEKVQLRWLTIMDQSSVAFGDMAKTINSPANQLRVLKQQWENLSRSIGNVFMPIVTTVLPYINAVVIALRNMIDTLATAMGYELPDYTDSNIYTDVTGNINDVTDATDSATKANEKYKKSIMGFDELNILTDNGSKSKSSTTNTGGGNPVLDDAIGKKTDSYIDKWNDQIAEMKNKAEDLAAIIQPKIEKFVDFLGQISPLLEGIGIAFAAYEIITWFSKLADKIGLLSMTPAGVIAIAIGALAVLVLAIKKHNDDLVKSDLAKRFGDITLSLQDMKDIADDLTSSDYTAKIDVYVTEKAKLEDMKKAIQTDINTLEKLGWKVSVGLKLTKEEQSTYSSTIKKFISDTEDYIDQQNYVIDLAINAVIQDDEKFNKEMTSLVDEYFNGSKDKMERLGKRLRNTMDNALADGVIDATEQKTINNLIKEMNEVTSQISDAQFQAKLQMITVDGELTADSFKGLTKQIQGAIDNKVKSEGEAYQTALVGINVAYKAKMDDAKNASEKAKLQQQWDADVKELGEQFSQTKATITLKGMTFSLGTLTKNYQSELKKAIPGLSSITVDTISPMLYESLKGLDSSTAMNQVVFDMMTNYQTALSNSGMSAASKEGLQQMLDALKPSTKQLQKIYDDALKAGTQVPDGVTEALTNEANLGAISGDMDAMAFLMGQKLSTDPKFLELLSKSKDAGVKLNGHLIEGLKSKIPDLKIQGEKLVFNVQNAVDNASSSTETQTKLSASGKNIVDGVNKGITKNKPSSDSTIKKWAQGINGIFDATASSSTYKGYGKNIVDGLNNGVKDNQNKSQSPIETWANSIADWFKGVFGIHSPSTVAHGWGGNIVSGLVNGIQDKWTNGLKSFQKWLSGIPGDIADGIGSLYSIGKDLIGSFIDGFKSISLPKLDIDLGSKTVNILGKDIKVPSLDIKLRAVGGLPDMGEMFVAREAGPELVGRIGRSNAVVNNDQIVQSVSSGVANAVAETMIPILMSNGNSSGGNTTVRVPIYLGKEQLAEAVLDGINKRNRRFQTSVSYI